MAQKNPMDVLRELAEKTLNDTTTQLGKEQQTYRKAVSQLHELENYEREYLQQLQGNIAEKGMPVATLIAWQSFIGSLGSVVKQHTVHVNTCQNSVEKALQIWQRDKQRLNSFETLKSRADAVQMQKQNRQEQKMMDEFAQRAAQKSEML